MWHIKQCGIVKKSSIFYLDLVQNQPYLSYSQKCTSELGVLAVGQQWATWEPQIMKSLVKIS